MIHKQPHNKGTMEDLTGRTYGFLSVLYFIESSRSGGANEYSWMCSCSLCGSQVIFKGKNLRKSKSPKKTCGRKECARNARLKHGESQGNTIYRLWVGMRSRCRGDNKYAKKGRVVCSEWDDQETGYAVFKEWVLTNYPNIYKLRKQGYQLDRIKNKGPYSPENCRFTTPRKNMNNRDNSVTAIVNGEKLGLTEILERYNPELQHTTAHMRLRDYKWSFTDALFLPSDISICLTTRVKKRLKEFNARESLPALEKRLRYFQNQVLTIEVKIKELMA